ncbi:MAG: 3-hydroxyacyl-ACP dehydratase FabZ [Rhizobiales bacterium]|jgi:3-hydroxyacyl-[acyl-carrier-protein] dehydratase|nr:3-hydroxyacyl-ACP dehydratase FabZ [Hyphomicrobiales bacterium]
MADDAGPATRSLDIQEIYQLLPHRPPFLMVDRIKEIDGDNFAIGIKNVSANEPHFAGHFPDKPIMPGVLIIEGMAQTAGAICILARGRERPGVVYFMTIDDAKFRKPVTPGDTLEYHVRKARNRGNIWKFDAEAMVDGTKVAEATISALIADE